MFKNVSNYLEYVMFVIDEWMNIGEMVEWFWHRKAEVLAENLIQCYFVHQKSHMN